MIQRENKWTSGIARRTAKPKRTVSENARAQQPEGTKERTPLSTAAAHAVTTERNDCDHDCFHTVMFLGSLIPFDPVKIRSTV